jgi:hypothetical protein
LNLASAQFLPDYSELDAIRVLRSDGLIKALQEHLDNLAKMVDGDGTSKHEICSQIALIQQDVARLQAGYERFTEAHAKLQLAHVKLETEHARLKSDRPSQ